MKNVLKITFFITILSGLTGCQDNKTSDVNQSETEEVTQVNNQELTDDVQIFKKGEQAPSENFTGTAWVTNLVAPDSVYTTATGSVIFEAGARTNWHSHPPGQLLLVTEGVGYHQIQGQPKETIRKGDVVKCPPNVSHWHGATPDSSMTHIYIVPNTDEGVVNWGEPVTDEEFSN